MTEWDRAKCVGQTDLFFSEEPEDQQKAKSICALCPLTNACLEHALTYREAWGIWAGLDYKELCITAVALGREPPNRKVVPHGTEAGWAWHRRQKLKDPNHETCEECTVAYNIIARDRVERYRKGKAK